jgi:glycosyltransferase involved in cell wall biosynthesis
MNLPISLVSVVIPVFEDGERALSAVRSMLTQVLPDTTSLEIIVVDDGSRDDTAASVAAVSDARVRLLRLAQNQGRSAARNAGAECARGNIIVFMDSDCLPLTDGFLAAHLDVLSRGHVASTGHVIGAGGGFWERYQKEASSRRQRQHVRGHVYAGSSQNLAVLKSSFEQAGGFDIHYRHYGFEDRDLLLRLSDVGSVVWASGASVRHLDALTLPGICRKMTEAGEYSAGPFSIRHPAAYRVLGYAAIDARKRSWLRPVGRQLGPHMPGIAQRVEPALHKTWLPYPLAKTVVKFMSAASFLYGTTRASD